MNRRKKKGFIFLLLLLVCILSACGRRTGISIDKAEEEKGRKETEEEADSREETKEDEAEETRAREKTETGISTEIWENAFVYMDGENQLFLWNQGGKDPVLLTDKYMRITGEMMADYDEFEAMMDDSDIDLYELVSYAPEKKGIYYPSGIALRSFSGYKIVAVFDLYYYSKTGEKELIDEDVIKYQVDAEGNVWYCKLTEKRDAAAFLYCYTGKEYLEIGELNGAEEAFYQVSQDGSYAVFYGKDGALYGVKERKETESLLQEASGEFYLSKDAQRCVCRTGDKVYVIGIEEGEKDGELEVPEENGVYILDEAAENILVVETQKAAYAELLKNDVEGDTAKQLWEKLKEAEIEYEIEKARMKLYNAVSGEFDLLEEGYLVDSIHYTEMTPVNGVYYFEMIPQKTLEGVAVTDYFGSDSIEEVLEDYEESGESAFDYDGDMDLVIEQAQAHIVSNGSLRVLPEIVLQDQTEVRRTYNSTNGKSYIRVIRYINSEEGELILSGEDVYEFDREGNCHKVAETVVQALVISDSLYYTRGVAATGNERLYSLEEEGYLLEDVGVNLDQMRKSVNTGEIFYLNNYGLLDSSPGTLNCYNGKEKTEMAEKIYRFILYGDNCVAALQRTHGSRNSDGRLLVFENGEEKELNDEVLMLMKIQE